MRELIYKVKYNDGLCSYLVEKELDGETVSIIIYDTNKEPNKEVSRIRYKNTGKEYFSPFLSWYNILFCSNSYGPVPDYEYMHRAVQEGKKTAATVYLDPKSDKGKALVQNLPAHCSSVPYGDNMLYVFHKGCLADYFDFEDIHSIYEAHGAWVIDWKKVREYFYKPMSFFGNETKCGFSLQCVQGREQTIITGLLLGYPIESTISFLL